MVYWSASLRDDDIAQLGLAPSAKAMRKLLLAVCDAFASEYSVGFNANESKYVGFVVKKVNP